MSDRPKKGYSEAHTHAIEQAVYDRDKALADDRQEQIRRMYRLRLRQDRERGRLFRGVEDLHAIDPSFTEYTVREEEVEMANRHVDEANELEETFLDEDEEVRRQYRRRIQELEEEHRP